MSFEEKAVLTVFVFTALAWITRSFILERFLPVTDTSIAVVAAIVLFIIPSVSKKGEFLMDWDTAKRLPWGVLLLFGGGLAIAAGFSQTGLAQWIGEQLQAIAGVPLIVVILVVAALILLLTEITSNTATATMMSRLWLHLPWRLMSSFYAYDHSRARCILCIYATGCNATKCRCIWYRLYKIGDMIKAGFWINVAAIFLITAAVYFWLPITLGIDVTELSRCI